MIIITSALSLIISFGLSMKILWDFTTMDFLEMLFVSAFISMFAALLSCLPYENKRKIEEENDEIK